MVIHLIGNYEADGQQSMRRFAELLQAQLSTRGIDARAVRPQMRIARGLPSVQSGFGKYAAYIDKYVLFPRTLRRIARDFRSKPCVYHICDHSNAVYAAHLPLGNTLITCHDMLAIRGGLGDGEVWCRSSWAGSLLQKWILGSLRAIPSVACVSEATRNDFKFLTRRADSGIHYVPSGVNAPFSPVGRAEARQKIEAQQGPAFPSMYLLHVGSGLPRKNRVALLHTLKVLGDRWKGAVVFAGAQLSASEKAVVTHLQMESRVVEIVRPDHDLLNALYSAAHCLVFPSFAEGFGWPVIEAQSCDCPVVCSDLTSVPEVAGDGAIICGATDYKGMADSVLSLENVSVRSELVQRGRRNLPRFSVARMTDQYTALYEQILSSS